MVVSHISHCGPKHPISLLCSQNLPAFHFSTTFFRSSEQHLQQLLMTFQPKLTVRMGQELHKRFQALLRPLDGVGKDKKHEQLIREMVEEAETKRGVEVALKSAELLSTCAKCKTDKCPFEKMVELPTRALPSRSNARGLGCIVVGVPPQGLSLPDGSIVGLVTGIITTKRSRRFMDSENPQLDWDVKYRLNPNWKVVCGRSPGGKFEEKGCGHPGNHANHEPKENLACNAILDCKTMESGPTLGSIVHFPIRSRATETGCKMWNNFEEVCYHYMDGLEFDDEEAGPSASPSSSPSSSSSSSSSASSSSAPSSSSASPGGD